MTLGGSRELVRMSQKLKKPTINDVARLSGVSKKTVSRVINRSPSLRLATREKVEKVIAELGYVPNLQARALALQSNFLLTVLHDNPNAQTVLKFQEGVLAAIRGTEFAVAVRPVDRHSPDLLDDIRHFVEIQRPYGVFLLPPISENNSITAMLDAMNCRYVRMGSAPLDVPERMVESNDRAAVQSAVERLIQLGHKRIALVAGPSGFRSARERRAGFLAALERNSLEHDPALEVEGTYRFTSGIEAAEQLLSLDERPTAIFSSNDEMAAGILQYANKNGIRVPDELSLIGFDDAPLAALLWPTLTTVRWPIEQMAMQAARKIVFPEDVPTEKSQVLSELIERESIAPPPR